jgi:hypothetical protein
LPLPASIYRLGRRLRSSSKDRLDYVTYLQSQPKPVVGAPPALTWQTVDGWAAYNPAETSGATFPTFNARIVLDKSLFPATTTKLRLTFDGPINATDDSATGFTAAVGLAATGGNAWDFNAAPVDLTFAGLPSVDMIFVDMGTDANHYVADDATLTIDGSRDVIVSMLYAAGDTGASAGTDIEPATTWHLYLNATGGTVDELAPAALTDVRAVFGNNHQWALSKIEAFA